MNINSFDRTKLLIWGFNYKMSSTFKNISMIVILFLDISSFMARVTLQVGLKKI